MLTKPDFNKFIRQKPQQVSFQNSVDSAGSSFNNGSLLSAANTLIFNSPSNDNRGILQHQLDDPKSFNESPNFSKTLMDLQLQQNSNADDLDFDLHYTNNFQKNSNKLDNDIDLFEEDLTTDQNFEAMSLNTKNRILNNPINFETAQNSINSVKKNSSENSPINSASFAGFSFNSTQSTTPQNSVSTKFNSNRALMKMQLMKQQSEQEIEKKTARTSSCLSSSSSQFESTTPTLNRLIHNPQYSFNNNISNCTANNNTNNFQKPLDIINTQEKVHSDECIEDMPTSFTTEVIPRSVLSPVYQNEIKLDNPTKYHVMQIAKNLQQTTIDHQNSPVFTKSKPLMPKTTMTMLKSISERLMNYESTDDISILPTNSSFYDDDQLLSNSQLSLDSQNSNFNQTQLSSPASSLFSLTDQDGIREYVPQEFDSLLNKNSLGSNLTNEEIQEEINRIEECLNLPKTLPTENCLNAHSPSSFSQQASSSCPADLARIKQLQGLNLTQDEIKLIVKDRQKKDNHNMIERRRRFNINDRIKELGSILPKSNQGEIKQNKGSILKASVDYIKNLKHELNKSKEIEEKFRKMTVLNRKLISRIKELETQKSKEQSNPQSSANSFNDGLLQIKQEPKITLHNLVTASSIVDSSLITNNYQNETLNYTPNLLNEHYINSLTSPRGNFHQNDNISILNDALNTNDILNSPANPLLCNPNIYNDSLMDSINGI